MIHVLRDTTKDGKRIIEYTKDGITVSHTEEFLAEIDSPITQIPEQETTEQKIERLELQVQQDNLILFDVLATIYDEVQNLKGSV